MTAVNGPGIDFSIHRSSDDDKKFTLYRKTNGFSGDMQLKILKEANERKEKSITDDIDALKSSKVDILEANSKITKLQEAVKALSSPMKQISVAQVDYFGERLGPVSSSDPSVSAQLIADIKPQNQCPLGEIDIEVRRMATRDNITGSVAISGKDTSIGNNATIIYMKGVAISIDENATIKEIVAAFQAEKNTTEVSSMGQSLDGTNYYMALSSQNTGSKITLETILDKLDGVIQADNTSALGLAGTIKIGAESAVITPSMSLNDIRDQCIADITLHAFAINGTTLEVDGGTFSAAGATEPFMTALGLTESATSADDLRAEVRLNGSGTSLYSTTNTLTEVYPKATIELLSASAGTKITMKIKQNTQIVVDKVKEMVEIYNEFINFAAEKTKLDPENSYKPAEGATLAKDSDFKELVRKIKSQIHTIALGVDDVGGVSGKRSLTQVGIDFAKYNPNDEAALSGKLEFNEQKFTEAIEKNFEEVRQLFGFTYSSSSSNFIMSGRPDNFSSLIADKDVLVKLQLSKDSTGTYSAMVCLDDGVTQTNHDLIPHGWLDIDGEGHVTIKKFNNDIFNGLRLNYIGNEIPTPVSGKTTESTSFRFSQGVADRVEKNLRLMILATDESSSHDINRSSRELLSKKKHLEDKLARLKERNKVEFERMEKKMQAMDYAMGSISDMYNSVQSFSDQMLGGK